MKPYPRDLIAYARQRHHMLSSACALADHLGIPATGDAPVERSLDALKLLWAVSVPGELLDLYSRYALARYQEVRAIIHDHGLEDLVVVETLVARDMELFSGAAQWRKELPSSAVDLVDAVYPPEYGDAMTKYGAKLVAAVPLVVLLAWEGEWLEGLRRLEGHFGGIEIPKSSKAAEYVASLSEMRDQMNRIERQLDAAGAIFRAEPA